MREIKFRAWDKESEKMIFGVGVTPTSDGSTAYWIPAGAENYDQMDYYPDAVLMQYTGLKDKNGKEIYEGDILRVDWQDKRYPIHNIGPVEWAEDEACFQVGEGAQPKHDSRYYMEVIDNIYENPELVL